MAIADLQYRAAVVGVGAVVVVGISALRFCGSVSLPPKPAAPVGPTGSQSELIARVSATPTLYLDHLRSDASAAGVPTPSLADMSRKFPYHDDDSTHVLGPNDPAIEIAGLRLKVLRDGDIELLKIDNLLPSDVAYEVTTSSSLGPLCNSARPLPFDAMLIHKNGSETRTECVYRSDSSLRITKVETLEVPPLPAVYIDHTPPALVGVEDRIARGHQARERQTDDACAAVISQVVQAGIDRHDIGWRDLADFYARHRCQSYQFPPSYRALKSDNEHPIPAAGASL